MFRKIKFIISLFFNAFRLLFKSADKIQQEIEAKQKAIDKIKKENPDIKPGKKDQQFFDWQQKVIEKLKSK